MSGILKLENLNRGTTLKQGDKTVLSYRLSDADGGNLNIAGKTAVARLMYPDFTRIGYESGELTVSEDHIVRFSIDSIIPSRLYYLEITVDGQYIFPSRSDEGKLSIDRSSMGAEITIIENAGIDVVVSKAVDLINKDPSLILDEEKLIQGIIENTSVGSIEEYYNEFGNILNEFNILKPKAEQSVVKSDEAIRVANSIDAKATSALSLSQSADALSKQVQSELNQIVSNGESSAEVTQARIDASGETNETLKERLDKEHNEVTTQLVQTDFVEELRNHNASNEKMRFMVTADRILEINVPLGGKKYASYVLRKDNNDDFMKFSSGDLVELEDGEVKYTHTSYETTTGAWTKVENNPNHYARGVGATAEGTFYGTGFNIYSMFDNRGGMWEIAVDGEKVFEWSTNIHAHGGETSGEIEGVRGLDEKEHTWVATFIGEDPNFPPPEGELARGWFVSPSNLDNPSASAHRPDRHALQVFKYGVAKDTIAKVLHTASNKEFAFSSKPSGTSSSSYWFPDHGTGTAFAVEQSLYVDNVLTDMSESKTDDGYVDCTNVKVIQKLNMIHPDDPEPLAEATVIHSYNSRGATYKVNWKWLKPTLVTGYVGMFSVYRPTVDRLRSSIGKTYDAWQGDGSTTPLIEEKDLASSYVFYNADGEARFRDFAVAMTIHDIDESFRWGATNRLDNPADPQRYLVWLQHRDDNLQKLYPQVYNGAEVQPGEEFNFGATIFLGVLPYASELIK